MVRGGTEDKESCEDKALETVTTVVNKHLSHVAPHKQVANTLQRVLMHRYHHHPLP